MSVASQSRRRLRKLLRDMTRAQASLLARVEALDSFIFQARAQIAPINSLPAEVLSEIFSFCSSSHPRDLFTVNAVSRFWRNVALNDPRLWSILSIQLSPRNLSLYLSRSRNLPLHIRIKPLSPLEIWRTPQLTSFLQMTLAHPGRRRIHSFEVIIPSRLLSERFADAFYQFTGHGPILLEDLEWAYVELLFHSRVADEIVLAGSATVVSAGLPALQCSKLHSLVIRSPFGPSSIVTELELHQLASHTALHTLELTDIQVDPSHGPQSVSTPMPSLRTVKFRMIEPLAVGSILKCLSMQSVETLVLDFSGTVQPESHVTSTISFNFPNLRNLTLIGLLNMRQNSWKDVLSQNVGIEELTCESSSFGNAELGLLSSSSISPGGTHSLLLPALRYLRLQDLDISRVYVTKLRLARGVLWKQSIAAMRIVWDGMSDEQGSR
jgi:hypothetical protein